MLELLSSLVDMIGSIISSLIHFIGYIPKLFKMIASGSQTLLAMFNYLPSWVFAIGSITIAIAVIWIIIEII